MPQQLRATLHEGRVRMSPRTPILAVDDSAPIREMIVSVLAPRGHKVVTAADGQEALDLLRSAVEPFTILLDVVMPGMDGLAVCAEVAGDDDIRAIGHKIILMSSSARLSAPSMPVTAGQLPKPFTRQQLVEAIEAAQ